MTSEPILPDVILQPISEDQPTGPPLRDQTAGSPVDFHAVRDAANDSRTSERKLTSFDPVLDDEVDKPDPPKWNEVLERSVEILSYKSKDLWVAAWMIEALCRLHGFRGLCEGFRVTRQLCERYWGQLHPGGDEEDYDYLMSQLSGLNGIEGDGTLIDPIRRIPITAPPEQFSFFDFVTAAHLDSEEDPEKRQKRIDHGQITMGQFEAATAQTSEPFFVALLADIDAALQEFDALTDLLLQRCKVVDEESGSETQYAPASSNIRRTIDEVRGRVVRMSGLSSDDEQTSDVEAGAESGESEAGGAAGEPGVTGPIKSRDDAFRQILTIASYFEKTEPHSPVSYSLRQVVRWGRLGLPELLKTLIDSQDVRNQLFRQIGIDSATDGEDGED